MKINRIFVDLFVGYTYIMLIKGISGPQPHCNPAFLFVFILVHFVRVTPFLGVFEIKFSERDKK